MFSKQLNEKLDKYHLLNHPFYKSWNDGKLTREIIKDYAEQYYQHVNSCSGNFARQTGKMVGLEIPVIPVQHQYIVTEPIQKFKKEKKKVNQKWVCLGIVITHGI